MRSSMRVLALKGLCVVFVQESHCYPELTKLHDHISGAFTGCVITQRQLFAHEKMALRLMLVYVLFLKTTAEC